MANVPSGGVKKKKLTLQTRKRYHINSPTRGLHLNDSGKSEPFTKCGNTSRKQLLSLCIPKSSLVPPLPVTKVLSDGKAEDTPSFSLPAPNFELLTSRVLLPLDLKRCQPHSVIVLDKQKPDISSAKTTPHQTVLPTGLHRVAGPVSHDLHRKSIPELSDQHKSNYTVEKAQGMGATVSSNDAIHAQRKHVKVSSSAVGDHHVTISSPKYGTSTSHRTMFDSKSATLSKTTETSRHSLYGSNKVQSSRKRMWNEGASDDDDEFDKLCNMVNLSFDADVTSDLVAEVTTSDNSRSGSQSVCHVGNTTAGLPRQSWTCPMCNEQFEGRSAGAYECEQHLIKCLAMDVM